MAKQDFYTDFDFNGSKLLKYLSERVILSPTGEDSPVPGSIVIFGYEGTGRRTLAYYDTDGRLCRLQNSLHTGDVNISAWPGNNTNGSNLAMSTQVTGSSVVRNVATTNLFTAQKRIAHQSGTTAGSAASIRNNGSQYFRSNGAGVGGFLLSMRFGISAIQTSMRGFFGMSSNNAALSNANPSTFTNQIGVGFDSGDTTFKLMHNDGSGACTVVDLGSQFPANTVNLDWYELRLYCTTATGGFYYRFTNLSTGVSAEGFVSSDIPAQNTLLCWHMWLNNGTAAGNVILDTSMVYVETNY